MKNLLFNGQIFEVENVVKTDDAIVGYIGNTEAFAFRGISDFTQFQLKDENGIVIDFPPQPPTEIDKLRLEIAQSNTELFEMMLMLSGGAV